MSKHRSKRTVTCFTKPSNTKHIVLNQIFYGDKDALINYLMKSVHVEIYDGERGYVYGKFDFNFDFSGYDEEKFRERMKHSKAWFRKSRD